MKRFRSMLGYGVLAVGSMLIFASSAGADEQAEEVMKVEEDWVLVVNDPGVEVDCPQFHTIMSPFPDLDRMHFQVNWNYREYPDFQAGGLEFITWDGEIVTKSAPKHWQQLSTSAETISWTQRMVTNASAISFQVVNGQSSTWGSFGGMTLDWAHPLTNLNQYTTSVSTGNSLITYGSNRVNILVITEVRKYDKNGDIISRDSTPRVIYQYTDPEEAADLDQ